MQSVRVLFLFAAIFIAQTVVAQGPPPRNVNVVNTPDVNVINDETSPVPVNAQTITEYRVVGFTTTATNGLVATVDGNGDTVGGFRALHQLCKNEVAHNARAASVSEYLRSTDAPPTPVAKAWVIPSGFQLIFVPDFPDNNDWRAIELGSHGERSSGGSEPGDVVRNLTCMGFQSSGSGEAGLVALGDARLGFESCTNSHVVACAAPVAVAVTQ